MRRGEYIGLFTDTEVNTFISIYQTSESVFKIKNYNLCIFIPYFEICEQTRKLTIVSCQRYNFCFSCEIYT